MLNEIVHNNKEIFSIFLIINENVKNFFHNRREKTACQEKNFPFIEETLKFFDEEWSRFGTCGWGLSRFWNWDFGLRIYYLNFALKYFQ
jgi:hypothetical protein